MFLNIKKFLYFFKIGIRSIFIYPQEKIDDEVNYDLYWKERRGDQSSLNEWQKERAGIIARVIGADKEYSILDVGCGDGAFLQHLSTLVPIKQMIGVDTSSYALQLMDTSKIEAVELDFSDPEKLLKIPKSDYVFLLEVLEHMSHAEKVLHTAFIKSDEGVFFSFPNTGFITYRLRLLFGKFPMQWRTHPAEHLRFWTDSDLKWWLQALGYENYKIFYYKGVPVINKLLPSLFSAGFVVLLNK